MSRAGVILLAVAFLWGCEQDAEEIVLARVGDGVITAAQLRDFESRLPENLRIQKAGAEVYLDYLQDIIDKELFIQEARKRGLQERQEVARKVEREKTERILRTFLEREIHANISIADKELLAHQAATGRDRAIKVRRIVVATWAEAEEIARALGEGGDFADFADRTLLDETALEGGRYLIRDHIYPPILQEMVFPLKVGEVSETVEFGGQYGVYQIVDEGPVELEAVRIMLAEELFKQRIPPLLDALMIRLRTEHQFLAHRDGHEKLIEFLERGDPLDESVRQIVLYEIGENTYTAGEFVDYARHTKVGFAPDARQRVEWFAAKVIEPRLLMLAGARAAGIESEVDITSWHRRREEGLLLVELHRDVVADILADEGEARRFYDENPRIFHPMESVTVQEILVASEEEAALLVDQIEQGGDVGELAEKHSLRRRAKGHKGIFHIHSFEKEQFGDLLEAAEGREIDQLIGPVEVAVATSELVDPDPRRPDARFYSLFIVRESVVATGPEPFEKVEKRARAWVRRIKRNKAFHQFMLDLRYRNEGRIEIYEEAVEHLVLANNS